jgi:tRNA threonylcarbamoyladenosine biosynthesis protein TsaE
MADKIQEFILKNEDESKALAQKIAKMLKPYDVIAFAGDLGSGKTFLCRQIIKYLCSDDTNVTSPTFNLLQTYDYDKCSIYHFDLYRLEHISEIYELGIEEAFAGHISLIEWPEIISTILPKDTIHINIKIIDDNMRKISIKSKLPTCK